MLATVHRPENTDHPERLAHIVAAFADAPLPVLFPVHPRTRPLLVEHGVGESTPNIHLTDPVGYLDMLALCSAMPLRSSRTRVACRRSRACSARRA